MTSVDESAARRPSDVCDQPRGAPLEGETGWLLESTTPWPDGVYWLALLEKPYRGPRTGRWNRTTYTSDPNKALRFDSKAAAEDYRDRRCEGGLRFDLVATEHEWPTFPSSEALSLSQDGQGPVRALSATDGN